jgi:hypothetical protein
MATKKKPKVNKTLSEEQWRERGYGSVKLRVLQTTLDRFKEQADTKGLERHQYLTLLVDAVDRGDFTPGVEVPKKRKARS